MADYWKSNPRRWCDFCKCWLEDNKPVRAVDSACSFQQLLHLHLSGEEPSQLCRLIEKAIACAQSIQFHEKGVKHKKNFEEHIKQARARGTQKLADEAVVREQLEAINKAALDAVGRDAEADPTLHSVYEAATKAAGTQPSSHTYARESPAAPPPPPPVHEAPPEPEAAKDEATGLGLWQTVEVSTEEKQHMDEEQQRLEAKRARLEARAERKRKEKTVEFGVKEVDTLQPVGGDGDAPAAFKKRKTDFKRQIRRKDD